LYLVLSLLYFGLYVFVVDVVVNVVVVFVVVVKLINYGKLFSFF